MKKQQWLRVLLAAGVIFSQAAPLASNVYAEELSADQEAVLAANETLDSEADIKAETSSEVLEDTPAVAEDHQSAESFDEPTPIESEPLETTVAPTEEAIEPIESAIGEVEPVAAPTEVAPRAAGVPIDGTNFPDPAFQDYIKTSFDSDNDGYLSDAEMQAVTRVTVPRLALDITGVKLFVNLQTLSASNSQVGNIDVSGMSQLTEVYYGSCPNLKTLDFRNCQSLRIGWHSQHQEIVYISAGMINYIGCYAIPYHTGNIVIDLSGFYTDQLDGSKTVDLNTVISPALLEVFSQIDQPNFDKATSILAIPAGEGMSQFEAGKDASGNPTVWTFYTAINKVDDVVVTFKSNGGTVVDAQTIGKDEVAVEPTAPTRDGFTFDSWYADEALTTPWDFATPIAANTTLYAKWTANVKPVDPVVNYQVTFESNGGSAVAAASVPEKTSVAKPGDPTKEGFTFDGWYADKELSTAWDFATPITGNITLYAKWQTVKGTPAKPTEPATPAKTNKPVKKVITKQITKNIPQTSKTELPKTGDEYAATGLLGAVLLAIVGLVYRKNAKKTWKHTK